MRKSILVIEDDEINMAVMIGALNAFGIDVIPALNGPAGLSIAKSRRLLLILCDIHMPHLNGFGVLKGLRSDSTVADTPIIAVTSLLAPEDTHRYLAAGFDGVLGKPIVMEELEAALREHGAIF